MSARSSFSYIAERASEAVSPHYKNFLSFAEKLETFAETVSRISQVGEHGFRLTVRKTQFAQQTPGLVISITQNVDDTAPYKMLSENYYLASDSLVFSKQGQKTQTSGQDKKLCLEDHEAGKIYLLALLLRAVGPYLSEEITKGLARLDDQPVRDQGFASVSSPS